MFICEVTEKTGVVLKNLEKSFNFQNFRKPSKYIQTNTAQVVSMTSRINTQILLTPFMIVLLKNEHLQQMYCNRFNLYLIKWILSV